MKRLFKPQIIITFIASVLFTVVLDVITAQIGENPDNIRLTILALLVFGAGAFYFQSRKKGTTVLDRAPIVLRGPHDWWPNARKGLIVFVSLYNPFNAPAQKQLSVEDRLAAANAEAYETLDFENSNLLPIITAIDRHGSKLQHCWLISTTATSGAKGSSLTYVPALKRYLREKRGATCQFHSGEPYAIRIDDDAQVTIKTRQLIERIFDEGKQYGLTEKDILADFTAGPRSMVLGLFWACVDGQRDVQFVGTHYDEESKPEGELFPVIFSFNTENPNES